MANNTSTNPMYVDSTGVLWNNPGHVHINNVRYFGAAAGQTAVLKDRNGNSLITLVCPAVNGVDQWVATSAYMPFDGLQCTAIGGGHLEIGVE